MGSRGESEKGLMDSPGARTAPTPLSLQSAQPPDTEPPPLTPQSHDVPTIRKSPLSPPPRGRQQEQDVGSITDTPANTTCVLICHHGDRLGPVSDKPQPLAISQCTTMAPLKQNLRPPLPPQPPHYRPHQFNFQPHQNGSVIIPEDFHCHRTTKEPDMSAELVHCGYFPSFLRE